MYKSINTRKLDMKPSASMKNLDIQAQLAAVNAGAFSGVQSVGLGAHAAPYAGGRSSSGQNKTFLLVFGRNLEVQVRVSVHLTCGELLA